MGMQHFDRRALLEQRLMGALLAVFVARALRVMRHRIAVLPDDGRGRCAVGIAIALVGGDDAVLAVDHHERLLMRIDQALECDVHR
jgi:hypothetical protein